MGTEGVVSFEWNDKVVNEKDRLDRVALIFIFRVKGTFEVPRIRSKLRAVGHKIIFDRRAILYLYCIWGSS